MIDFFKKVSTKRKNPLSAEPRKGFEQKKNFRDLILSQKVSGRIFLRQ